MADAINAKNDVLGEHELDAVSGGFIRAFIDKVLTVIGQVGQQQGGGEPGPTGGQNDPAQMFQQILQQMTGR
jgi:hypothetical protein